MVLMKLSHTALLALLFHGAIALPIGWLSKRTDSDNFTYLPGHLNYKASATPFLTLADGVDFVLQNSDGNFVAYQNGVALWSAALSNPACASGGCHLTFQGDGNLVAYDGTTAYWSTSTSGTGAKLVFRREKPYVTVYNSAGTSVWNSGTATASNGHPKEPPKPPTGAGQGQGGGTPTKGNSQASSSPGSGDSGYSGGQSGYPDGSASTSPGGSSPPSSNPGSNPGSSNPGSSNPGGSSPGGSSPGGSSGGGSSGGFSGGGSGY